MRRFWLKPVVAAALAGSALVPVALADGGSPQGAGGPPARDGWSVTVGGGGLWSPDYEGSDDYEFRALPYLSVRYEDWLSFAVPEGLKVSLINEKGFRAGVLAGYRFDREAKDNIALAGWGDVDGSAELGGFVEYRAHWLKLSAELRHYRGWLERLQAAVDGRDAAALEAMFELASRTRRGQVVQERRPESGA